MAREWSTLAKIVYKRTYSRKLSDGRKENFPETVERAIQGNIRGHDVPAGEVERLRYYTLNRKAGPSGRGYWFSGTTAHERIGGVALNNCWGLTSDVWKNFVVAADLLMLGGGVGLNVGHRYTSKLPKVRRGVVVAHKGTRDADFIVPDSREGWCELLRRVLEAFFATGRGFTYSTVCVRGYGEPIQGFGGTASGPLPLIELVQQVCAILIAREGRQVRPIDAADVLCAIGAMVVAGNVRRSAILILGDSWDKDFLKAKRWDLGTLPKYRAYANWSVDCEDVDDLHPLYWQTYLHGEAFGLVNLANIRRYGRMGELRKDTAQVVNPCVPAGTQILTDAGYENIEETVGKLVRVWNGFEWSWVTPSVTGTDQSLVKVTLSSGQTLTCTPAHRFHVADGYRGKTRVVEAGSLTPGMKLFKATYPVVEKFTETAANAYSQGFYAGDGTSGSRAMYLYGEKKLACAGRIAGDVGHYDEDQDRTYVGLNFQPLPKNFVPFRWNVEARLEWLAGLFDSDGTVLKEGGVQVSSIDRQFLLDTQKMLTTVGTPSKVTEMTEAGMRSLPDGHGGRKEYPCQTCHRLLIGSVQVQTLRKLGLRCSRLDLDKEPQRDASRFVQVVSVEPAGVAEKVYCFTEPLRHLGCFDGVVTGQCGEATLECYEPCNLQDLNLPALDGEEEFCEAARLMQRWGKRVVLERYHHPEVQEVVGRNMRVGTSITGCLQSPLFCPESLDRAYEVVRQADREYSKELGVGESIRNTTVKPSGTKSKLDDIAGEGIHPAYSRYAIQRVRFAANDPLVTKLRAAGHHVEPVRNLDGTLDHGTLVVDFYQQAPDNLPCADDGFDTWKQLDVLLLAQKHWSDQSVSVTVYYQQGDIPRIKEWLRDHLRELKSVSFLSDVHGFAQAPKEAITREQYEAATAKLKPVDVDDEGDGDLSGLECAGGVCPVK